MCANCTIALLHTHTHTKAQLWLEAISLNLRVRRSIILTERENCTKHSCDPRVFLTTTRDLLHISLYSPIAYQHLPGWTCAGRRSQMIHIIFITWLQELDRPLSPSYSSSPRRSPRFSSSPLCKTMDYVWYAHESMHSVRACVCVCIVCVTF